MNFDILKLDNEENLNQACIFTHPVKYRLFIQQQIRWAVKFNYVPLIQHYDPVRVHDRVQSMGYREDRAIFEFRSYRTLDEVVRFQINGRRGFIQHQNLRLPQQSPAQTDELPLAHR